MGRPISEFHISLLAPISKRGCETDDDDDDDDDDWIMFQLCSDAKI